MIAKQGMYIHLLTILFDVHELIFLNRNTFTNQKLPSNDQETKFHGYCDRKGLL